MAKREIKDENVQIGKLLQKAREDRKVLQSEMVEPCALTKNHISAVERGVSQASIKMLLGYCKKLNTTPNEILEFHSELNLIPELKEILSAMDKEQQQRLVDIIKLMR